MSVTVAIASSSAAISASASARASRARDEACQLILDNYNPKTASVEGMHNYVGCVERLHPHPTTEGLTGAQMAFVFVLICAVVGALVGLISSDRWNRVEETISYSFIFTIVGFIILLFVLIIVKIWF